MFPTIRKRTNLSGSFARLQKISFALLISAEPAHCYKTEMALFIVRLMIFLFAKQKSHAGLSGMTNKPIPVPLESEEFCTSAMKIDLT